MSTRARAPMCWPTLALALGIYAGFAATTWYHADLPLWLLLALGAWWLAWQSSLQHEVVHGHPTRWRWLNTALAMPALWLWVPFARYRDTHLRHHRDPLLTDPLEDPESQYVDAQTWASWSPAYRAWRLALRTLLGRLTVGPVCVVSRFLGAEIRAIRAGEPGVARAWLLHLPVVVAILWWVLVICALPAWQYAVMVYAGTALALLRSFAEHRAAEDWRQRTAIVENTPIFALLFLNNTYHVIHHEQPGLPWYRIPAVYRAERERVLAQSGGHVYRGYWEVARRYWRTPHDHPLHPSERQPA